MYNSLSKKNKEETKHFKISKNKDFVISKSVLKEAAKMYLCLKKII